MAADDYEARFMSEGEVLLRERHVSRVYAGLMAIPALGAIAGALAILIAPDAPAAAALVPLFVGGTVAGAGLFFAVMRTTVTTQYLNVQYGLLGPSIPIAAIESHEVVELSPLSRLAFGPKLELDGSWRYIPPGVKGGVRVRWSEGGKERSCLIGAGDPEALSRALSRAREGRARGGTTLARVELDEEQETLEAEATAKGESPARSQKR
ncbi:MAG: hypothetical protein K8H88_21780 [Sandaracinaceae bacterium]|nr:hypothetical protein [Sandaracinaceae bacterium]